LVSVAKGTQMPREISLSRKLNAREKIIQVTNKELGLDAECVGLKGSPTFVAAQTGATFPPRKRRIFQGDPREAVKALVEELKKEGLLPP